MKHTILGIGLVGLVVLFLVIFLTVNGRMTKARDIEDALPSAVENALEETMSRQHYTIDDNKEFMADFVEGLVAQVSSDSEIEIKVSKLDYEKGLLGIKVVEHYKNPNGKVGKHEYETVAVFTNVTPENVLKNITYAFDNGVVYASYKLAENDSFILPSNPVIDGKTFVYWIDTKTNQRAEFPEKVHEDMSFKAVFNE